jgi:hypothetical protein
MSKFQITAAAFVICVILLLLSFWRSKAETERAQRERDAKYRATLATFERDLRLGMHRSDVYQYLRLHSVPFGEENGKDAAVAIGKEPAPANSLCNSHYVAVVFAFNELPHQQGPSPLDNLRDISVEKSCQK